MALRFDKSLSEAVPAQLRDLFPDSLHVRRALGAGVPDESVWEFAKRRGMTLITRDGDYERMSAVRGAPPKIVWIALHNPTNAEIVKLLRERADSIARFQEDSEAALLALR